MKPRGRTGPVQDAATVPSRLMIVPGNTGPDRYVSRYRQPQTRRPLCHQHTRRPRWRRRRGPTTTTCTLSISSSDSAPTGLGMPVGAASAAFGATAQPIVVTPTAATAAPASTSVSIVRRLISMCLLPLSRHQQKSQAPMRRLQNESSPLQLCDRGRGLDALALRRLARANVTVETGPSG
jgi:hypothetical protein